MKIKIFVEHHDWVQLLSHPISSMNQDDNSKGMNCGGIYGYNVTMVKNEVIGLKPSGQIWFFMPVRYIIEVGFLIIFTAVSYNEENDSLWSDKCTVPTIKNCQVCWTYDLKNSIKW